MNTIFQLCLALGVGAGLGMAYFFGLRKTLERLPMVNQPHLWVLGSMVLRLGLLLLGFWLLLMMGNWEHLMIGLLGFLVIRGILLQRWGPQNTTPISMKA